MGQFIHWFFYLLFPAMHWELSFIFYKSVSQKPWPSEDRCGGAGGSRLTTMWTMCWGPWSTSCTPAGWTPNSGWATYQGQARRTAHVNLCFYIQEASIYTQHVKLENTVTTGWQRIISYFIIIFLLKIWACSVFFILVFSWEVITSGSERTQGPKVITSILGGSSLSC